MVNYSFLLILLIIVFTNLYFNYYKNVEAMSKKRRKKRKKKKKKKEIRRKEEELKELNEVIMQTNNYKREGILNKKLQGLNIPQLTGYLDNLSQQESKYDSLVNQEDIKKKLANNKLYIENLLSDFLSNLVNWKYS